VSIVKDPSGRRSVAVEVEVPGAPEAVWRAVATGPGITSWFVPTEVANDLTVVSHFGPGMDSFAAITTWEPPRRFVAESPDLGPGAPTVETEWAVEGRPGGTCRVRVSHGVVADTDAWDGHLAAWAAGWPAFFRILRLYLAHFPGQDGVNLAFVVGSAEAPAVVWDRIAGALGLAGARVGESRRSPEGVPAIGGAVEAAGEAGSPHEHEILMHLDTPGPGLAHLFAMPMGGQTYLVLRLYLYGDEAPALALRVEPEWQAWLAGRLPAGA
jgi:uncharacterized protein YndB with AHSA1/START domain